MHRLLHSVAVAVLLSLSAIPGAAQATQPPSQISIVEAAPFLGEWTLALEGQNGPATFALSIRADKDKVTADIASDAVPKQTIHTISLANKSLVLAYNFPWDGNSIDAAVTLTPLQDGKTAAKIDFAGGAYTMTGTATKKEKKD